METAAPSPAWAHRTAELLEAVRARAPLVQCITNTVVQNVTANVLLALGASPAMVDVATEAGPFARVADALLVNTGTPHAEPRVAALEAVHAARDADTPWVLDPVAVGSLPVRTALARDLLALHPTVLRGNASEVLALLGDSAGGRGVDSTVGTEDARVASVTASDGRLVAAVAVSGAVDLLVAPGIGVVRVANGTDLLTRITGGGCALGAVVAAFTSVAPEDAGAAAVAATAVHTIAAELAARDAGGPGTFQPLFLDRLASLTPEDVVREARITVERAPAVDTRAVPA
ncbi:hydroxyethylthiazole kinase [Curtobacterium flaccumfaciens]|uniref:hydroxyethylthiazole kinase n=1 Tax=Curtobacterium flaccumfaciens TaxID=2035 RepID=UPI001585B32E|nr:hydroxyethylthiazole kinase [Curtobacterium flaccumfaciens]MCS0646618.1 hydroxyethylthiazole kinase [Curtobacterium flaccumfaciens pv. flaccumfaciens]MCS6526007.1 hydroxyethylthiazole kinase [Curtobacterium flaccumfaciens pv. flaccumfaciens]MCS6528638.1 hydroxyethylthiazole kinase [Curtobacterium flaccumfaciens pv. flaccumfaciens]